MSAMLNDDIDIYEVDRPDWEYLMETVAPDYLEYTSRTAADHHMVRMFEAEQDFDLIGYALFAPREGEMGTYCLIHIFLVLENRLQGTGTALLEKAEKELVSFGVKRLEACCLEDDLEEGVPFLEKNGFSLVEERKVMKYTIDQLKDSPVHQKTDSLNSGVVRLSSLDAEVLHKLINVDSSIKDMDPDLSAVLMEGGKYCGSAAIMMNDDELCLESITAEGEADARKAYLELWKYAVETLIDTAEKNNIAEVIVRVDSFSDAVEKIIGTPESTETIPVYAKEIAKENI